MADFASALWNKPASAGDGGSEEGGDALSDPVTRSLRWDDGNNSNLYKATGSTDTTWTVAMWVKRSKLSSLQYFFSWGGDGINFDSSDRISIWNGSAYRYTTAVFKDTSSWYHLTISCNAGTITIYVNGVAHALSSSVSYPALGNVYFGRWSGNTSYNFDGYLADIYGIEGSALDHTSFSESNNYGGLKPKAYTGSFGTNGFHIDAQVAHDSDLLVSSIDRNDGDTTFADAAQGHGLVTYGSTHHDDTVGNPFDSSGTAIHFDGSGDYIKVWDGSSGDYDFGTADYTIECWVNISSSSSSNYNTIFSNSNLGLHLFERNGEFYYYTGSDGGGNGSSGSTGHTTNTWYHVAAVRDGTDTRVYINGKCDQTFTWNGTTDASTSNFRIGGGDHYYLDGYIYDFRVTGGEAKYSGTSTASDWANFDEITAPFELNPVYIGGDQSGNKNHFTPTNISGHDVMLDVPTKNYATLNPIGYIDEGTDPTFTEGNLKITGGYADNKIPSTIAVSSGKWYAEVRVNATANMMMGVAKTSAFLDNNLYLGELGTTDSWMMYRPHGDEYNEGNSPNKISGGLTTGDILQIALDLDNNKLWWGKNDTWVGTVGTSGETTITAGEYYFAHGYSGGTATWNFGQDNTFGGLFTGTPDNAEFAYEIPTGFKSLNTSNLDAPAVKPSENFNTVLWAGSGSQDNDISGVGFQPDFTWIKNRTSSREHALHDSVRGAGKELRSNSTLEESDKSTMFGPFQSDGFRVAESSVGGAYNDSGNNYVAWNWKESASAGFDIATYEGNSDSTGDTQDISHSLGVAPDMIIVKARDARAYNDYYHEDNWYVWHKDLSSDSLLFLNKNSSEMDYSSGSGYAPINTVGSSTFTVSNEEDYDSYANFLNWGDPYNYYTGDNERYVAYLFSGVEGFSKFGTYEGNNNADGPFIYCGFRPRWIMTKRIDGASSWAIIDTARDPHNDTDKTLASELNLSESSFNTSADFDILSNGFKIRHTTSNGYSNAADTHIFAAFAESPFKYANAR